MQLGPNSRLWNWEGDSEGLVHLIASFELIVTTTALIFLEDQQHWEGWEFFSKLKSTIADFGGELCIFNLDEIVRVFRHS